MGQLVTMLPSSIDALMQGPLNDQARNKFQPFEKVGAIRDLFHGEITRGKTLACGIGLPLSRTIEALNIAFGAYAGKVLPLLLSARYVKSTDALLGFTHHGATTCVLEIDAANVKVTRDYIKDVWKKLENAGINFTLYWGKFNTYLTSSRVVRMYGQAAVNQWKASRATLMESDDVSKVFDNAFLRKAGLATP